MKRTSGAACPSRVRLAMRAAGGSDVQEEVSHGPKMRRSSPSMPKVRSESSPPPQSTDVTQ